MKSKNIVKKEPLFVKSFKLATKYKNTFTFAIAFTSAAIVILSLLQLLNIYINSSGIISWLYFPFIVLIIFLLVYYYKIGLMVLFDAMFLVSFFGLQILATNFSQSIAVFATSASAFVFILFSLIYYLIVLFVYSFFKYSLLDFIKSLFEKTIFSFKKLGQFYSLNIIIAGIFFAIMILANFLLASMKEQYRPFVFIFLATPYLLFLYVIINTSHSLFYQDNSIKDTIKKSFSITFTKIKIYRETILIMIVFALILWLLFFGSGYLLRFLTSKNYSLYLSTYAYFKQSSVIFFDLVFYFVILINRISFYAIIRENK